MNHDWLAGRRFQPRGPLSQPWRTLGIKQINALHGYLCIRIGSRILVQGPHLTRHGSEAEHEDIPPAMIVRKFSTAATMLAAVILMFGCGRDGGDAERVRLAPPDISDAAPAPDTDDATGAGAAAQEPQNDVRFVNRDANDESVGDLPDSPRSNEAADAVQPAPQAASEATELAADAAERVNDAADDVSEAAANEAADAAKRATEALKAAQKDARESVSDIAKRASDAVANAGVEAREAPEIDTSIKSGGTQTEIDK